MARTPMRSPEKSCCTFCWRLVANKTCSMTSPEKSCCTFFWQQVVVNEFGKRHDTTDTTDFCPRQLLTGLLSPVHIVAEKCHCRRKRRLSPKTARKRRQSHFSATVWTGFYGETGVMNFGLKSATCLDRNPVHDARRHGNGSTQGRLHKRVRRV